MPKCGSGVRTGFEMHNCDKDSGGLGIKASPGGACKKLRSTSPFDRQLATGNARRFAHDPESPITSGFCHCQHEVHNTIAGRR